MTYQKLNELTICVSAAIRLCSPGQEYATSGRQPQMVTGASESYPHQQEQHLPAGSYVWTNPTPYTLTLRHRTVHCIKNILSEVGCLFYISVLVKIKM